MTRHQIYIIFKFFSQTTRNNLFFYLKKKVSDSFYMQFHKILHCFILRKTYFYAISLSFSFLWNKQTISSLHFFFLRAEMSAKGRHPSYSAGGYASSTRPLEVLSKTVTVYRPPWMSHRRNDINNSPFGKFEREFGGHNASYTALLMIIIFHFLNFPVSPQITIRSDFFRCDLYDIYVTSRGYITYFWKLPF